MIPYVVVLLIFLTVQICSDYASFFIFKFLVTQKFAEKYLLVHVQYMKIPKKLNRISAPENLVD